jgi:putative glutamine amidotransferase
MQEMNVASGGSLYQDIPFQIYKKKTYESVIEQDVEKQHKNYQKRINNWSGRSPILHFHRIRVTQNSALDHKLSDKPLVTSVHHQSVKKLGKNFQVIATSLDKKVIEAISSSKYKNVYGVQFHPEFSILYKQKEFENTRNNPVSFNQYDKQFHRLFWADFSKKLINKD